MTVVRTVSVLILALAVGIFGAFFFNFSVLPYLLASTYFEQFQFVKDFKQGKIVINPKETVYIQESTSIEDSVIRVAGALATVQNSKIGTRTGLVLTSDGLVVTTASGLSQNAVVVADVANEQVSGKVALVKDGLALIKVEKSGLQTVPFANSQDVKLGQRVFLLAKNSQNNLSLNEGVVRQINQASLLTNIQESQAVQGSPLLTTSGELVGLNMVDKDGGVWAIPASLVQALLSL